jgi:hypothetical protein
MPNHRLQLEDSGAGKAPPPDGPLPVAEPRDQRFSWGQLLHPLREAIASLHHRTHQGVNQVIIRFNNGYGAIISEYGLLEGIYEIAPLRFAGDGAEDYEFYFRSHVPDLTWCSESDEILSVCGQIARLLPHRLI